MLPMLSALRQTVEASHPSLAGMCRHSLRCGHRRCYHCHHCLPSVPLKSAQVIHYSFDPVQAAEHSVCCGIQLPPLVWVGGCVVVVDVDLCVVERWIVRYLRIVKLPVPDVLCWMQMKLPTGIQSNTSSGSMLSVPSPSRFMPVSMMLIRAGAVIFTVRSHSRFQRH